jgi:hypothetical protein
MSSIFRSEKNIRYWFQENNYSKRKEPKVNIVEWIQHLDSEEVRECRSSPEVAHICKDDYSDDESSFFSHSIKTIMPFE